MGNSQDNEIRERAPDEQHLINLITASISNYRLKLQHQTNIYNICVCLKNNFIKWNIRELYLGYNMISIETIEQIIAINFEKAEQKLRVLSFSSNDIKCADLKCFKAGKLNCVRSLYLDHNLISKDGCFYLSRISLQNLETLDLSYNQINQEGCSFLLKGNWPKLINLLISHNKINQKGLRYLAVGEWPSLAYLQAKANDFQPSKQLQNTKFRTQVKLFRLQIQ